MIEMPRISETELAVFQGKKVIIYGVSEKAAKLCEAFKHLHIALFAFCVDANAPRKRKAYCGYPVLTTQEVAALAQQETVILQLTGDDEALLCKLEAELQITRSGIEADTLIGAVQFLLLKQSFAKPLVFGFEYLYWHFKCWRKYNALLLIYRLKKQKKPLVICLPTKTADYTISDTIKEVNRALASEGNLTVQARSNNRVISYLQTLRAFFFAPVIEGGAEFVNVWHNPRVINNKYPVKVITAVREPIAQNLSSLYQKLPDKRDLEDWMLGEMANMSKAERARVFQKYEPGFVTEQGDVQLLFDYFLARFQPASQGNQMKTKHPQLIQQFVAEFKENVVDITAYPFDQEKGYAIIKEGNVEVFVYQLEKLNHIVPELSAWLGVPFDKLINGNQASDKWLGENYKQAQKDIKITQAYFDDCYHQPYVQHCYSPADIEKFKEKWRSHIQ